MSELSRSSVTKEIYKTLRLFNFFTRRVGYNFIDNLPNTVLGHLKHCVEYMTALLMSFVTLCVEINYVYSLVIKSSSVADFVANLHLIGFDIISFSKLVTIWYKSNAFRRLINELPDIWLIFIQGEEGNIIKQNQRTPMQIIQFYYIFVNILGIVLYNVRPILIFLYHTIQGVPVEFGPIWHITYPFEITTPMFYVLFFIVESYAGIVSVCSMLGYDILFMTMTNHIAMLLRLLQKRIRHIGNNSQIVNKSNLNLQHCDYYEEIILIVKTHQRLIKFVNDLENTFAGVNLINILLSSINICCAFFNTILDPWLALSNKLFLGAALTQVGILCWYADEIYTSSTGVAGAVYENAWYKCNVRCQQAFLILLQRSQKPLYYTALKFRSITISTYSSIITSSYSYFTLLYTLYHNN